MGLDTSARAMVARAIGASDLPQANYLALQCLFFNMVFSAIVMSLGIILSDGLLSILGVSDATVADGSTYQRYRFAGSFFFGVHMVSGSLLQAGGDTFTPMKARIINRAIHMILSPIMTFGWLGFPGMGISGAAASNGIGSLVGALINLYALFEGTSRLKLTLNKWSVDWRVFWAQVRIGAPASITSAERSLAQVVLVGLAAPFGSTGLAAYAITQRVQMFGGFGSQGLAQAAGIIAGQSLGANQPPRARTTVWWALGYVGAVQGVLCSLVFLFPEALVFVFSRDPEVVALVVPWLRIEVAGYFLFAAGNVLTTVFNTAGDTMISMLVGLGTLWGIQQPIAIVLTGAAGSWTPFGFSLGLPIVTEFGVLGIAVSTVVASATRFLILFVYFRWGPWWKKNVLRFTRPAFQPQEAGAPPSR